MKTEYLYGANTAEEILKSGRRKILRLIVSLNNSSDRIKGLAALAKRTGAQVEFSAPAVLDKIARGGNHQGVIVEAETVRMISLEEALDSIGDPKKTVWAGLDGITDPMNLGAIVRSAACFGVSAIIIPERRTVGLTPTAQKAASGAVEMVDFVEVVNLNRAILELKDSGFWIYGADMNGKSLDKTDFVFPAFVVIGSEGEGLHQKTREHCDEIIAIPQKGGVESLNASTAAAVMFYEISKKL